MKQVRIGVKPFNEQFIISHLIGNFFKRHGYEFERVISEPRIEASLEALREGVIDFYIEYTGTAYNALLNLNPLDEWEDEEVFRQVKNEFEKENISVITKLGYRSDFALGMRSEDSSYSKISDIADISENLTFSCPPPYIERQDGLPSIRKKYNIEFKKVLPLMPDEMYESLNKKESDVITAFLTDSRVNQYRLNLLKDDKFALPPYESFIIGKNLDNDIIELLNSIRNKISNEKIRSMNYKYDFEKMKPEKIVEHFYNTIF